MMRVLVRGSGDVGSAVAHALFRRGFNVLMHDTERPAHTRRGMAFADAAFEHKAELAGILAKRAPDAGYAQAMLQCGRAIPLALGEFDGVLAQTQPDVLVDARMRKRAQPEDQRSLAPLAIGLGPNFAAGATSHYVVETAWGDALGSVIEAGAALPLQGEPQPIAGRQRERYVYAPCAGVFCTRLRIGDSVDAGQAIATIGGNYLHAPLAGRLRGLTHDGAPVERGGKVIEVDPRGEDAQIYGIGVRPGRIAAGVLEAIARAQAAPASR